MEKVYVLFSLEEKRFLSKEASVNKYTLVITTYHKGVKMYRKKVAPICIILLHSDRLGSGEIKEATAQNFTTVKLNCLSLYHNVGENNFYHRIISE